MNDPFLNIHSHAHAMMIEQIMALIGRASSDPKQYRRTLESFEMETLRRTLDELTENFCGTNGAKTEEPLGCRAIPLTDSASKGAEKIAVCVSLGSPSSPAPLILQSTLP